MVKQIKQNKEVISFCSLFIMLCTITGFLLYLQGVPSNTRYAANAASGNPTPTPIPTLPPVCVQIINNIVAKTNVGEQLIEDVKEVQGQVESSCGTDFLNCQNEIGGFLAGVAGVQASILALKAILDICPVLTITCGSAIVGQAILFKVALNFMISEYSDYLNCVQDCQLVEFELQNLMNSAGDLANELENLISQWESNCG